MSTNLNQIDELRKRAKVSYSEAKEALEACNDDILEALVYLEKSNKSGCEKTGFFDRIGALLKKGSNTRLVMYKQDKTIFNLSMNIAILIAIITLPFIEFISLGALVALFTGHRFKLVSNSSDTSRINQTLDKVSNAVDQIKENISKDNSKNTDGQSQ
jgi:hypothetical protein